MSDITFPAILNPGPVRAAHPVFWRTLTALRRQAGVRDRQLRKLNLTFLAASWKGVGHPPPVLTDPKAASYQALATAARTLESADILTAYRTCAAYLGAQLET